MKFTNPTLVERVIFDLKLANYTRAGNRANINILANGEPPFSSDEVDENKIDTNVNFLDMTTMLHQARRQFINAFQKSNNFFTVTLDCGPPEKRGEWSHVITSESNKQLKRSAMFMETQLGTWASTVLHGIGPSHWADREAVVPFAKGIEDVLIPARTLRSMENLEFFAVYKQYTPSQLWAIVHGPKVDKAWNVKIADAAIEAAVESVLRSQSWNNQTYSALFSPEKLVERYKEDSGFFAADAIPTIDIWDFYFLNDEGGKRGWNRRMILDFPQSSKDTQFNPRGAFIYDSGDRAYADSYDQILHFQFADLSAVSPFRYHSVRSLGWMLYALCHLQNRLMCRFSDHCFRQLIELFRVRSPDDIARTQVADLVNFGIVPEGIEWVKGQDRYQVNPQLIESLTQLYRRKMSDNSASYTQDFDFAEGKTPETATATMAKVHQATALVGSMLTMAYNYEEFRYREMARRLCIKNSADILARNFRVECLKQGVPEEYLNSDMWNIEAERVLGAGNKMLEIAVAEKLMAARNLYDPEPQRDILRMFTLATTDDAGCSTRLVPPSPVKVTDSTHDAELALGTLMHGFPVSIKTGINHIETVETLMRNLIAIIGTAKQRGMLNDQEVQGVPNIANYIEQHIKIIGQDENEKQRVRQYMTDLGNLMNEFKGMAQQYAEAKQQASPQQGMPPEAQAKVAAIAAQGKVKMDIAQQSHQQKTAQRQAQWQLEMERKQAEHKMDAEKRVLDANVDIATKDAATAAEIRRQGALDQKKDEGKIE